MTYLLKKIKYLLAKIDHYYHPDKCVKNAYFILGVYTCSKCNRHLAYFEYTGEDKNNDKVLHINKPFEKYFD